MSTWRKALLAVAVLWFLFALAVGFYADEIPIAVLPAFVATVCLVCSLRRWWHLAAVPLYLFFALEIIVGLARVLK